MGLFCFVIGCVGSPISRAEREQQKRWALLKGEVRRQHLEELWMKMEAEKAKKKRKKKQGTDDTLWFCEDITSKGYTRFVIKLLFVLYIYIILYPPVIENNYVTIWHFWIIFLLTNFST